MSKKVRFAIFIIGLIVLGAFYFFSREVKHGFLKQTDFDTTVRIQDRMPKRLDSMWENFSFFVEPGPSIIICGLLTIAAFVDRRKKKIRLRALIIPLLFGILVFGELYGKSVVHHPAPPFFMIKHPTAIFPQFYVNEQYSYPSGHTARATFFGLILLSIVAWGLPLVRKTMKKWIVIGGATLMYILIVAIGHIYLGSHWLSDIIGGGLLGGALGVMAFAFLQ